MVKEKVKDGVIKGSLILFVMIGVFNLFNYLFHFSMARMLGPADYGILAVLMSFVYIFSIPSEAIQTIISRYTSKYLVNKNFGKIKELLSRATKRGMKIALILFIVYIPFALFFANFLNINLWLLIITGIMLFTFFTIPINRGVLQGLKRFGALGWNMIFESSLKFVFGVILVVIGWKVFGAVIGFLIGLVFAFFIAFLYIGDILKREKKEINTKVIYSYSWPVFVFIVAIVLMYSVDTILARRFFAPEIAGQYAVVSMLGKVIFFGAWALGKAMFPFTSERQEKGGDASKVLKKSLTLVSILSIVALFLYLVVPKLVIRILFGPAYVPAYGILFIVGLAFTFLSFANIFILYELSTDKKRKITIWPIVFVVFQVALMMVFHKTIFEFSLVLMLSNLLMFVYSLFLVGIRKG